MRNDIDGKNDDNYNMRGLNVRIIKVDNYYFCLKI
jgi:hypothetical protein